MTIAPVSPALEALGLVQGPDVIRLPEEVTEAEYFTRVDAGTIYDLRETRFLDVDAVKGLITQARLAPVILYLAPGQVRERLETLFRRKLQHVGPESWELRL